MERTPSPSRRLHTPPAPIHGFADSYEPYSPRRSSRVAAQRELHPHLQQAQRHTSPRARRDVTPTASSKRKAVVSIAKFTLSPPSSPVTSPQHRSPRTVRRAHFEAGPLDSESDHPAPTPARRLLSTMAPVRSYSEPLSSTRCAPANSFAQRVGHQAFLACHCTVLTCRRACYQHHLRRRASARCRRKPR
jgi:hypothetical protein